MRTGSVILGASSMATGTFVRIAIQIAILPIIGRLLGPHAYGQIALVSPFVFFAMLLSSSGLVTCIVRAEVVTKELEGTLFCFSAGVSFFTMFVFMLLAYPLGHLLNEPQFPPLLMAMSGILLLSSLQIVPSGLLLRAKKYHWLALSDIVSSLLSLGAVLLAIALELGVWSLVAQQVVLWLSKAAIVMTGARSRPRLLFDWQLMKDNLRFGGKLMGSALIMFIAGNIDNVLIGALLGTQALGFYALAFQIVGLPQIILAGPVHNTVLTEVSEAHHALKPTSALFLKTLRAIMLLGTPVMMGMALTAPLYVTVIMSDKWLPMARLILLLAPFGLTQISGIIIAGYLAGLGKSGLIFRLTLLNATLVIIAILAGVCIDSGAVAIGVSAAAFLGQWLSFRSLMKECSIGQGEIIHAVAAPFVSSMVMGCFLFILSYVLPVSLLPVIRLFISVIAGALIYMVSLMMLFHEQLATDLAYIKAVVKLPSRRL